MAEFFEDSPMHSDPYDHFCDDDLWGDEIRNCESRNDDSQDNGSSDDDDAWKAKLAELEARIEVSTEDYDAHLEKVHHLRGSRHKLKELRLARLAFAKSFPLTPQLWLEWIEDETRLAHFGTLDQQEAAGKQLRLLFEPAIEDYLSVDIWLQYCHFSIDTKFSPDCDRAAKVKNIFERAIEAVGTHVGKGALIWETYRDFLIYLGRGAMFCDKDRDFLIGVMPWNPEWDKHDPLRDPCDPDNPIVLPLGDPVGHVFRQQLAVPLLGMESTMVEYKKWLLRRRRSDIRRSSEVEESVLVQYQRALSRLQEYKPFEDRLATLTATRASRCQDKVDELLTVYSDYLGVVVRHHEEDRLLKGAGEEALVSRRAIWTIYERCIADLCLSPMAWLKYLDYLEEAGGFACDDLASSKVCARAVRNVPEWPDLWIRRLLAMERLQRPDVEVREVVEAALSRKCFFRFPEKATQVWLTYIAYRRRSLFGAPASAAPDATREATEEAMRNLCAKAVEHTAMLSKADPEFRLHRLWATIEASLLKDLEAARRLWSEVILPGGGLSNPSLVLENVAFEKIHGGQSGPKHIRQVFARSLEQCFKDRNKGQKAPVTVLSEAWLQYERENGTFKQFEDCRIKVSKALAENSRAVRSEKASSMKGKADKGMKLKSKPDKTVKDGIEEPPKKKPKVKEDPFKKPTVPSKTLKKAEAKEVKPGPVLGGSRMKGRGEGQHQVMQMVLRSLRVPASNGTSHSIQRNKSNPGENQQKKSKAKTKVGDREIQVEISNPHSTALKKAESKLFKSGPVQDRSRRKSRGDGQPQVMQMVLRSVQVPASNGTSGFVQGNKSHLGKNERKKSN